jgi:hypothetical protein
MINENLLGKKTVYRDPGTQITTEYQITEILAGNRVKVSVVKTDADHQIVYRSTAVWEEGVLQDFGFYL